MHFDGTRSCAPRIVHEYVALDLDRVVDALERLAPIERFLALVQQIESGDE
jgi:uncharacterized protein YutE (UPF0331/DUF86 family)